MQPFCETLYKRDMTEYALIYRHGLSANTPHRMRHGEAITTKTLDALRSILERRVEDILEYVPPEKLQGRGACPSC